MTEARLKELSEWQGVVLPPETGLHDRFVKLFGEVLESHAEDPENPTQAEIIICRMMAADVWRLRRFTDDAKVLMDQWVGAETYSEGRRALFRETDERLRLRGLAIQSIAQARRALCLLSSNASSSEASVVPLRKVG